MMKDETFYICIGGQRSATTWIYRAIEASGDYVLPPIKEIDFFRYLGNYQNGMEWYASQFKDATKKIDITPEYAISKETSGLIFNELGSKAKILLVVRNPIDRLISAYQKHQRNGELMCTFDFFITYNIDSCVERSLYMPTIRAYEKHFDISVAIYEDMKNDSAKWLNDIENFFNVRIPKKFSSYKYNPSLSKSNVFRQILNKIYRLSSVFSFIRLLKERIENSKTGNKFLYGGETNSALLYSEITKKEYLLKLFKDDMGELGQYLNRDLTSMWKF